MEASGRPRGLRVRTTCATEDEFVAQFHRRCDDESLFAPTEKMIPVDADCAFSLELSDGTPMLRGLGVVLGSWPTADNPFGTAGVHVAIVQLTTGTQPLLERLVEARARAEGTKVERTRRSPITQRRIAIGPYEAEQDDETEEESVVRDVRHSITREMEAAAPIEMIDERASHTIRYEGPLRAPAIEAARMPSGPTKPPAMPARLPALPLTARPSAPAMAVAGQAEPAALPDPPTYPGPMDMRESQTVPERPPFARGTPLPPDTATALDASTADDRPAPRRRGALFDTSRVIAARLAPIGKRLAPITAQVTALPKRFFAAPAADAPWWRNGRVAAVFVSGILVGVLVSHASRPASPSHGGPLAAATPANCTPDRAASAPTMAAAATVAAALPSGPSSEHAPASPTKPAATTGKTAHPAGTVPATPTAKIAATAKTPAPPASSQIAATAKMPAATTAKGTTTTKTPAAPPPAKVATTAKTSVPPAPPKVATTAKTSAPPAPTKVATTAKTPAPPAPTKVATTAKTAAAPPTKIAVTAKAPAAPPTTKPAKPAAPKKGGCHSLDCI